MAEWMTWTIFWAQYLGIVLFTICMHELAHLFASVACGVKVNAFGIGFFKPYFKKVIKDIEFRLSPWLIGGYCDIKGMDSNNSSDDFLAQPYRKKAFILLAGVTVNLIIACICYLINYGSIKTGLMVDWGLIKAIFTKDMDMAYWIFSALDGKNFWLIQLSLLNIFCAVSNLLPIPALDGGHLWLVLMEKPWKQHFIYRYTLITKICFVAVLVLQVPLLIYLWV